MENTQENEINLQQLVKQFDKTTLDTKSKKKIALSLYYYYNNKHKQEKASHEKK